MFTDTEENHFQQTGELQRSLSFFLWSPADEETVPRFSRFEINGQAQRADFQSARYIV